MTSETKSSARVVHVSDTYSAVINKGEREGVQIGDVYLIYSLGPELTDPDTGESLGQLEVVRGRAQVTHVQDRVATLESKEVEEIRGARKVIKRDGGSLSLVMAGLGIREEIEEGAESRIRPIKAEAQDYAKLLRSKS